MSLLPLAHGCVKPAELWDNRRPPMTLKSPDTMTANEAEPKPAAVAVVLVNWNGWRHVVECLDSLLAQDYPDFHVFVVDNDSHDGSVAQIASWCSNPRRLEGWRCHEGTTAWSKQHAGEPIPCRVTDAAAAAETPVKPNAVTVIHSGGNLGFAGGCNVGIRAALEGKFSFFWLLNTDTVVHRAALCALVVRARSAATIGMVGSTIRYYDRPEVVQALGGACLDPRTMGSHLIGTGCNLAQVPEDGAAIEREMVYVMGASMLVSTEFVRSVGLLEEDYFLYGEEIDWALRARKRFRLAYAPASHIFHKSGATSAKLMPLFTAKYYYRNRVRIVGRFFPERLGAARRGLALDLLRHSLRGRWGLARVVAAVLLDAGRLASPSARGTRTIPRP
jgi:GT2 family glycosyltransferase